MGSIHLRRGGADSRFMDKPTFFGAFFAIAGVSRSMEAKGVGANVWVRAVKGYRLHRDGRGDGARDENVAHLPYNGRNHYAALRNPSTDWTLQAKAGRLIGGPPPGAPTGKKGTQKVATPRSTTWGTVQNKGATAGRRPSAKRLSAARPPVPRR